MAFDGQFNRRPSRCDEKPIKQIVRPALECKTPTRAVPVHWEQAVQAVRARDYATSTRWICKELGVCYEEECLPLIRGLLQHLTVVEAAEAIEKPKPRMGAFSIAASVKKSQSTDIDTVLEEEAWSRALRSLFSRDAAVCLLSRLLNSYLSEPFVSELVELQASWRKRSPTPSECAAELKELCHDLVLRQVMPQFGLDPSVNLGDLLRPYESDPTVMTLLKEIDKILRMGDPHDVPLALSVDCFGDAIEASTIVHAACSTRKTKEGLRCPHLYADSKVQSRVLAVLGVGSSGMVRQLPLKAEEVLRLIREGSEDLARIFLGRNAFNASLLPMLHGLDAMGHWPLQQGDTRFAPDALGQAGAAGYLTELPTLELCAAVCTRILCVAQRLREAGSSQMLFLSIGSGVGLLEASIALHLGKALGVEVDLQGRLPLMFRYGDAFNILFVVTVCGDGESPRNPSIPNQITTLPYETLAAVRDFAAHGLPLFVFSCWPRDSPKWLANVEAAAGGNLAELLLLRPPPLPGDRCESTISRKLRTTELFPKTLSCMDYLVHEKPVTSNVDQPCLHHSHLLSYTPWDVPEPFLVEQISHRMGPFQLRVKASRYLEGVDVFRRLGFFHVRKAEDLRVPLPVDTAHVLKNLLQPSSALPDEGASTSAQKQSAELRRHIRSVALKYATGPCKSNLEGLLNHSSPRPHKLSGLSTSEHHF